ncbi:hypothetical protein DB41_BO00040 [Neochlamydia sp. TUME1]|nr:hypothetical protein DB41_BO00040 [Neochlamydia sp. TUME1]
MEWKDRVLYLAFMKCVVYQRGVVPLCCTPPAVLVWMLGMLAEMTVEAARYYSTSPRRVMSSPISCTLVMSTTAVAFYGEEKSQSKIK